MALNLGARFLLGGRIVTPRVFKILKIGHVIICIAKHLAFGENFVMHTLKQVYIRVVCVELYCLT